MPSSDSVFFLNTIAPLKVEAEASIMRFPRGSHSIATLLSSILCQGTQCAPATTPLPSRPIYSLPPLQPSLPLNASDNGNCASTAKYPSWTSNDWVIEDCYAAVQQLYLKEFLAHPDVAYNFVAPGVSPKGSLVDSQRTPRKYVIGKLIHRLRRCFWLSEAKEGLTLSRKLCHNDHDARLVPSRAAAGGYEIQHCADGREHLSRHLECGEEYRDGMHGFQITRVANDWLVLSHGTSLLGMADQIDIIGEKSAMGVFVWATNSHINEITGGFPVESLDLPDSDVIALDAV